jgi:hypothetical protein
MTFALLTCPHCNAPATVASGSKVGQRIVCARCGDSFTLRAAEQAFSPALVAAAASPSSITETPPPFPMVPPHRPTPRRNRLVGAVVLGVMAVMAMVSLTFALYTQPERRDNDTAMKQRPGRSFFPSLQPEAPPEPLSPWRLQALGYLPPRTNVVLGLHMADLMHDKAGQRLLDQPITFGRVQIRPGQIATWCGLRREDVDHLVLGIDTEKQPLPVAVLIVRTNRPYQPDHIRSALKGDRVPGSDKKNLYRFTLENPALPAVVWCIDDRTLALALIPSHLDSVPMEPRAGLAHLPNGVRDTLRQLVESGALLWVVGGVEERTRSWLDTLALQLKKADLERSDVLDAFKSLRTIAAWVQLQRPVRVGAVFESKDDPAAKKIEAIFRRPGEEANPNPHVVREKEWVTLQYKTDLETVLKAMER